MKMVGLGTKWGKRCLEMGEWKVKTRIFQNNTQKDAARYARNILQKRKQKMFLKKNYPCGALFSVTFFYRKKSNPVRTAICKKIYFTLAGRAKNPPPSPNFLENILAWKTNIHYQKIPHTRWTTPALCQRDFCFVCVGFQVEMKMKIQSQLEIPAGLYFLSLFGRTNVRRRLH